MYVSQINSNQPSSRGYLRKATKSKINEIVKQEVQALVKAANENQEVVNAEKIGALKSLGDGVIKRLEDYASKLHKDTAICFGKDYIDEGNFLVNGKDKMYLACNKYISTNIKSNGSIGLCSFFSFLDGRASLVCLDNVSKELDKINPQDVNKMMFKKKFEHLKEESSDTNSLWGRIKNTYNRYKANRLAKEYNVTPEKDEVSWGEKLRKIQQEDIKLSQETRDIERAQKNLEANNNKIAKEILEK